MTVVVVDDDDGARKLVCDAIVDRADMALLGAVGDGQAAIEIIGRLLPDLVLLDVQMPGADGWDVAAGVAHFESPPQMIFMTTRDDGAIPVLQRSRADYLLKPVGREDLDQALDRYCVSHPRRAPIARLLADVARVDPGRLMVRDRRRIVLLAVSNIGRVSAEGGYVRLHAAARSYLYEGTLADMESRLDPWGFARVHRNMIVRLDHIENVYAVEGGRCCLRLSDGTDVPVSRSYSKHLRRRIAARGVREVEAPGEGESPGARAATAPASPRAPRSS